MLGLGGEDVYDCRPGDRVWHGGVGDLRDSLLDFADDIINIQPHSGWYFIFGHSPNTTGNAQVRLFLGLPAMQLLLTTHKWVPWVEHC